MRVLVVDESAERAEMLRAALLLAGCEVMASLSPPLALLKAIEELRPDVIVIDTRLILDATNARFEELQQLREQLAAANLRLDERKLVERAKGLLMKARGLDEESAYRALRRMAMDQNRRIGEVARSVIGMGDLLG